MTPPSPSPSRTPRELDARRCEKLAGFVRFVIENRVEIAPGIFGLDPHCHFTRDTMDELMPLAVFGPSVSVCLCGHDAGSHDRTTGYCRAQKPRRNPCGCRKFAGEAR